MIRSGAPTTHPPTPLLPRPPTHSMEEVEEGRSYELVVSSMQGLLRYRMGDLLRCSGWYGATPKVPFGRLRPQCPHCNVPQLTWNEGLTHALSAASLAHTSTPIPPNTHLPV